MSHLRKHPAGGEIDIKASTVLPAQRERLVLRTDDGLDLVGELATPSDSATAATLVCLHPLPTHGGMMDSHVLRKASWRLPALAGVAVLRFNTRGTSSPAGTSDGAFDHGDGEGLDLLAAVTEAKARGLPNLWLLGWSFGTDVVLRHGLVDGVAGALLLSPPLRFATDADLDAWSLDGRPLVALVPEHDDYLQPAMARERFARVPQAEVVGVEGAKHLWVGEPYVRRVLDEIVARVAGPDLVPLPSTWHGPYETYSEL